VRSLTYLAGTSWPHRSSPLAWSRLAWTYLPPAPDRRTFDGSSRVCDVFRPELEELVRGLDGYDWEIGTSGSVVAAAGELPDRCSEAFLEISFKPPRRPYRSVCWPALLVFRLLLRVKKPHPTQAAHSTTISTGTVADPQVSPDGSQILYTRRWVDKIEDRWMPGCGS